MRKVRLITGCLVVVALLSACAGFDGAPYRSDSYQYNGGGHSHH